MEGRLDRIVADPEILSGKPCIRGTRISVEFLLELIASGATIDQILQAYPHLHAEDIRQAILRSEKPAAGGRGIH